MSAPFLCTKLVVADADAAIAFYVPALGAEPGARYTVRGAVVHADLVLPCGRIEIKDADEHDPAPGPDRPGTLMSLTTDDPDAVAQRMLDHGAEVVFAVADHPYGARGGRVRDPFGHQWMLQTPLETEPDAVQAALDAY
ncbi:VOC family protein [Auraticoccus monumenti]|uniref:Uncharacterized conserved protein PhnB, glyoxalase superfamily n=1 Tax=Auraticoccus monumenti TaxID=675864 RepID=A0A1G6Y858_9ACTN|nr:VOC family protein [Auraticoccus monumenti]SDD86540.1 Uncharacterized conserved protein PhnB, glyoxalase superfamily [Auraticoccus monumenti]